MLLILNQEQIYQEAVNNSLKNHKSSMDIKLMLEEGKGNPDGWKNLPKITWGKAVTETPLKPSPKYGRKLDL